MRRSRRGSVARAAAGHRWPRRRSARRHGAAPRPAAARADHPPCERGQRHEEQREEHEQERAQGRWLVSRSAVGTAATASTRPSPLRAPTPATTRSPDSPARRPGTVTEPPATRRSDSWGVTRGVRRSAVADAPTTRCPASSTCTTWLPETGTGRAAGRPRPGRRPGGRRLGHRHRRAVERRRHRGIQQQATRDQGQRHACHPQNRQPRAQAEARPAAHVASR